MQKILKRRLGRDIFMYAITLNPAARAKLLVLVADRPYLYNSTAQKFAAVGTTLWRRVRDSNPRALSG